MNIRSECTVLYVWVNIKSECPVQVNIWCFVSVTWGCWSYRTIRVNILLRVNISIRVYNKSEQYIRVNFWCPVSGTSRGAIPNEQPELTFWSECTYDYVLYVWMNIISEWTFDFFFQSPEDAVLTEQSDW